VAYPITAARRLVGAGTMDAMEEGVSRYYTPDEVSRIMEQARRVYAAWTNAPARVVAVEMYQLGLALGEVEPPSNGGNGHGKRHIAVDTLPEEATEGLTCSLSGG